jgi:predicted PilT family ATPase
MSFGQLIIGPPGCGKTTYCFAIKEYFEHFGRNCIVINLDPANDLIEKVIIINNYKILSLT